MTFNVKKRGKLTYYYEGDDPILSSLVVETLPDGDYRICFSGLTGGYSATNVLSLILSPLWTQRWKFHSFSNAGKHGCRKPGSASRSQM